MPRTKSARRLPLAPGLVAALALAAGCRQLVVFDELADGGLSFDSGSLSDSGSPSDAGPFCPSGTARTIGALPAPVYVVVALDRSTGMNAKLNDGMPLGVASADALRTVVNRYQKTIHFALVTFPGPSGCSGDPSCCVGPVSPPTVPGFSFALDACNNPGACAVTSQRAIAGALSSSYGFYYAQPWNLWRYVLLLSSGDPGCGLGPGDSCNEAESRVNDLFRNNVATSVFAVGTSDGGNCLGKLAQAGSLGLSATTATSSAELAGKLDDFVQSVARDACRLDLRPIPSSSDEVAVFQNGVRVPTSGPNGWDFDGSNHIRLHGTACDRLIAYGVDDLSIEACPDHH